MSYVGTVKMILVEDINYLFTGIGLLKDYELQLNVDKSVKPFAQPVRRIPFGLREKGDEKLDELLQAAIIEEVLKGPSGWISSLVEVPNSDGDVRMYVDVRRANEAIISGRYSIPTVEKLLHDVNGSTVFSKVDVKRGVHHTLLTRQPTYYDVCDPSWFMSLQSTFVWRDVCAREMPTNC